MKYNIYLRVTERNGDVHNLSSTGISRSEAIAQFKDALKNIGCFFNKNQTVYNINGSVDIDLVSIPDSLFNIHSIKGHIRPGIAKKYKINHLPMIEKL